MSDKSKNVLVNKTKVIFTVNDFDVNRETVFRSNDFKIGSNVWQIKISTNEKSGEFEESMVCIKLRSKSEDNLFVHFYSFIYNSNMKKEYHKWEHKFIDLAPNKWLSQKFMTTQQFMAKKDRIFPERKLIIGLIICVESKDVFECIPRIISYRNTFNVKQISDLNIICGNKEFFVSKAVLSLHSEEFEKIFENKTRKQEINQLIIKGIDGQVFEEFLKFIYYENSDKLEEFKKQLLIIADRYQVSNLKTICENLMFLEICATNAIKLLLFFDKFKCNQMAENCIEFINENIWEIKRKTPNEWKELIERHHKLLVRITERMSELINVIWIFDKNDINSYTFSYIK